MTSLGRWPKVAELREKLNGKAKAEPNFRFYLLHDKMYRKDVLEAAYALCCQNDGAPGVDGRTFEQIEVQGVDGFLEELAHELKAETYAANAVKRVLIPKAGKPGEFRALGIPTIKDRVVQQAAKLLLEPIFEADLPENAYGYRPNKSAHDAAQAVLSGLKAGYRDVVDADLSKYFDTIPHDQLMQAVARRIADRRMLKLIQGWLKAPVHVTDEKTGRVRIEGGKATKAGTPQGGVISPLLANIYFRRFLVAWERFGYEQKYRSRIVNYADDFVILTKGSAQPALTAARTILERIGLTLNAVKTRTCLAWDASFNFLGYTFGLLHARDGKRYLGMTPGQKSEAKYRETIQQLTASDQVAKAPQTVAAAVNCVTRGYWNYYKLGSTAALRRSLDRYVRERMQSWAKRKYKRPRKRKGMKLQPAKVVRKRIDDAVALLVYGRDIPSVHVSQARRLKDAAACSVQ